MKKISLLVFILCITASAQNFWQQIPTLPPVTANTIFLFAFNSNDDIFIGAWRSGFLKSTDNGENWEYVFGTWYPYDIAINSNDFIFISSNYGNFRSSDNGESWAEITGLIGYLVNCFVINSSFIFAGTYDGKILRSSDNGENWTDVSNGLNNIQVSCLATNSNNHIYVGTWGGGIFLSTNNGDSWLVKNNGLTGLTIWGLASLVMNNTDYVFTLVTEGKIFRSTNNGDNWIDITSKFNNHGILGMVINTNNRIFAAGEGVFNSTDYGENWYELNSGLDTTNTVGAIGINLNDYVYLAAFYIYRSVNSTTSTENEIGDIPSTFSLSQNYPNPFNPTTTITYQIPQTEFVSLKVYDILGREVATLVNEEKPAGIYEFQFSSHSGEGRNLTSGIYFYQLKTDNYVETKKMILLR